MKVTLKIPDVVWEAFQNRGKDPQLEMAFALTKWMGVNPRGRALLLTDGERGDLERLLNVQVNSGEEVVGAVRKVLSIRVDGTEVPINPDLLRRVALRARELREPPGAMWEKVLGDALERVMEFL